MEHEFERCQECGGKLPTGRSERTWRCRLIGLCRYCYRHKFPRRGRPRWGAISRRSEPILSYYERRKKEQKAFDTTCWSPKFYSQWIEYWLAQGIKIRGSEVDYEK